MNDTYIIRQIKSSPKPTKLEISRYLWDSNIKYWLGEPIILKDKTVTYTYDLFVECDESDLMAIKLKFPNIRIPK